MATLKDIAAHVGISVSAVSMALRDHRSISDETKRKVWEAQHVLGYKLPLRPPSSIAGQVMSNAAEGAERSTRDIVCLLIDRSFDNPTYGVVFQEMAEAAIQRHWRPIYLSATLDDLSAGKLPPLLKAGGIDGIIVTGRYDALAHQHLSKLGIPIVVIGSYRLGAEPWMSLEPDFGHGIRLFLDRLAPFGHQRFGLLMDNPLGEYPFHVKKHYLIETAEQGVESVGVLTLGNESKDERLKRIHGFLDLQPTAILTGAVAGELYAACQERGLRIPEDLSIIGLGASARYPSTPSVAQIRSTKMSGLAIEKLAGFLKNPDQLPTRELIPMRFYAGASIGKAPGIDPHEAKS